MYYNHILMSLSGTDAGIGHWTFLSDDITTTSIYAFSEPVFLLRLLNQHLFLKLHTLAQWNAPFA